MTSKKEVKSPQSKGSEKMEKGICTECAHYHDCPRMRGIDHCYNMHHVQPPDSQERITAI